MNEFVLNYQSLENKVKELEEIVDLLNYAPSWTWWAWISRKLESYRRE